MLHANRFFFAILACVLCLAGPAAAQSVEKFYRGNTIKLIVGYGPGGGHDTYARLLARHFNRHIPGKPKIIVENMPGASSLRAVQHVGGAAPKDGTVMAAIGPGLVTRSLTNPAKYKVKLTDYAWIGSQSQSVRVCYVRTSLGIKSWDDLVKYPKPIVIGETGRGSNGYINWRMLQEIFGVKVKIILGYSGGNQSTLAIQRGEVDGDCVSFSSVPSDWLKAGKITVVARLSALKTKGVPPGVPFIGDKTDDPQKKKLINFLLSASIIARPVLAAKGVPGDRIAALRKAFNTTMTDPKFLADAKKLHRPINGPMTGEKLAKFVEEIYSSPPELIAQVRKITK